MTGGVVDIRSQTVESISVIKLSSGLGCGIVTEVVYHVFFRTENWAELASPTSQFHYIQN
jgi:hypothetical protein